MLGSLASKIVAGVVSLSAFVFSSYTGNDPELRPITGFMNNSYFQMSTTLDYAFDNDFPDVFKSGTQIKVFYSVTMKSGKAQIYSRVYSNTVQYDHLKGSYKIHQSGTGQSMEVSSYRDMITAISTLNCSIPVNRQWQEVSVEIESWLPTVEFRQINRKVDLMVLWKYRKPSAKSLFNLRFLS